MPLLPIFFAAGLFEMIHDWRIKLGKDFNLLVFTGAFVLVTLVVFFWAVVFRQQGQHHSLKPARSKTSRREPGSSRRKHRRKNHRPTNPTLAETGGLPAARDLKTPPKSPL